MFVAWHNEVLVTRQIVRHKARIEVKYGRIWKHKVDMMYTAKCVVRRLISLLISGGLLVPLPWDQFHGESYEKSGEVFKTNPFFMDLKASSRNHGSTPGYFHFFAFINLTGI